MPDILYGRNAVQEALRAKRRTFRRLLVSSGAQETGTLGEVVRLAESMQVPVERIDRHDLDRQLRQVNHQGVALECGDYPYVELEDCLALADERGEPSLLLMLDHLQDPQNVGTLLRTAEAVGVHGVVLPGRRAAEVTPAVVNASSGATEHLRITVVSNLAQTIKEVQRAGVWVVGVEEDERAQLYNEADLDIPLALVLGAEGTGLARLTRERCDLLVKLPMYGRIESLNVSVAGSILLYHARGARQK
ncbi:MAG TPA: 23S rRNA (guanosine(2251)-2'-O)-methyltransferase RlmB [Roseiflexaceae bacterium]|jgi:23S rRNA (guanosine2251-2'-O)-methyltransferase|nr:23S rRNA (guanosine(2251)-2'-O)-methyltransferase RlmB [Roseiflexaceae bacterium]